MALCGLAVPEVVEGSGLPAWSRHDPDFAVSSRYRGADRPIDTVLDEGGCVDNQDVGGVADAGVAAVSDGDDIAAVGQLEGEGKAHYPADADVHPERENAGFVHENRGLVLGSREDHDGLIRLGDRQMKCLDGDGRGLAPLAVARSAMRYLASVSRTSVCFGFGSKLRAVVGPFAGC